MTEKNKLINLRESTAQRMDLSSEEQDKVFLQITLDFLDSRDIEEVLETLTFMTSGGRIEGIRIIVNILMLKGEYGYAMNVIEHLISVDDRDKLYLEIIKRKLLEGDNEKLITVLGHISNVGVKKLAWEYINVPEKVRLEQEGKTQPVNKNLEQERTNVLQDALRKAKGGDISDSLEILKKVFPEGTSDFKMNANKLLVVGIKNTSSLSVLHKIHELCGVYNTGNNILTQITRKELEIEEKSKLSKGKLIINNVLHIFLSRKKGVNNLSLLKKGELEIYEFLVSETLKCKFVEVSKKRNKIPYICFMGDERYVYIKGWNKNNPTIHKQFDKTVNGLRIYLIEIFTSRFM